MPIGTISLKAFINWTGLNSKIIKEIDFENKFSTEWTKENTLVQIKAWTLTSGL